MPDFYEMVEKSFFDKVEAEANFKDFLEKIRNSESSGNFMNLFPERLVVVDAERPYNKGNDSYVTFYYQDKSTDRFIKVSFRFFNGLSNDLNGIIEVKEVKRKEIVTHEWIEE